MTVIDEGVKKSVKKAVLKSVLETLGDVAETSAGLMHEALEIGVDVLDVVPVPGLAAVAKLVLNMWNAIEDTDVNDIRCFRLTERCAIILNSVRCDINNSGNIISEDMTSALTRLENSYTEVGDFLNKFKKMRSWMKILKRKDIDRDIIHLDMVVRDALQLFNTSVAILVLRQIRESEYNIMNLLARPQFITDKSEQPVTESGYVLVSAAEYKQLRQANPANSDPKLDSDSRITRTTFSSCSPEEEYEEEEEEEDVFAFMPPTRHEIAFLRPIPVSDSEDYAGLYPEVDTPAVIYSDLVAIFDSQYQTDTLLNDAALDELEKELEA